MRRSVFERVRAHALLGRDLRRADEEGAGPRLSGSPRCRCTTSIAPTARASSSTSRAWRGRSSTSPGSGSSWWCGGAPAGAPRRKRRVPGERLPGLLPRPQGPGHRRPRLHRLEPVPHAGRPRARRCWRWTACCPTTAATSSTSTATRTACGSTSPTCAATAWSYLVRGQEVLFNLAGQVSHIDSMTDPFTDLEINCTQPALDPRGGAPAQPRAQDRVRRHAPGLRQADATCRWTRRTC